MKLYFLPSRLALLSLFFLTINLTFAQRPQNFKKLLLTGKVVDVETLEPLEYATITLRNDRRPEMLQGGITKADGTFSFEVFPGKYNISTEYISFKTITQEGVVIRSNKDLGTINLEIEDSEVVEIKANIDSYPINPPATEQSRLERLYDLSRMVFADNIADEAEKNLLKRLVIGLGFNVDKVDQVIEKSFLEISKGSDEEEFIASFR